MGATSAIDRSLSHRSAERGADAAPDSAASGLLANSTRVSATVSSHSASTGPIFQRRAGRARRASIRARNNRATNKTTIGHAKLPITDEANVRPSTIAA